MEVTREVVLYKIDALINEVIEKNDEVVVEIPLKLFINDGHYCTLMCSPTNTKSLVIGFLFYEKIISGVEEIENINEFDDKNRSIHVWLKFNIKNRRQTTTIASSGLRTTTEFISAEIAQDNFRVSQKTLFYVIQKLLNEQKIFHHTGGTHAAGLFNSVGELLSINEDIGRHNALDKVIGDSLLNNFIATKCGVVLSSRVSYEMISKIIHGGFKMVVAVSAPTSLAVELALKHHITLCAFVRYPKANIYTYPERVIKE